jgi:hypothetical protein
MEPGAPIDTAGPALPAEDLGKPPDDVGFREDPDDPIVLHNGQCADPTLV